MGKRYRGEIGKYYFVTYCNIGVGRFRILGGGQRLEHWGAKGGGGQIPSRHMTS